MMTPSSMQRNSIVTSWLVPALLAVITGLLVAGGTNVVASMQAQSIEMQGLRNDFQKMQVQMEARITHLEDFMEKTHPIDYDNLDFPELAPPLGKKNRLAPLPRIPKIQNLHKD